MAALDHHEDETRNIHSDAARQAKAAHDDGIVYTIETITPDEAGAILQTAALPRPDRHAIDVYAKAMEAGAWIRNGQPIIFDEKGRLIDGVQRLTACVETGIPLRTDVARNAHSDTLHTIDQQRRRSYVSVLESRGYDDAGAIVRTMSKLIRIENGLLGKNYLTIGWDRYRKVLNANPEIVEAVRMANRTTDCLVSMTVRPTLCFMGLRAGHGDAMADFLREMSPNWRLNDSIARVFSMQIDAWRESESRPSSDVLLGHAILYFNEFLKGAKAGRRSTLSWKPDLGTIEKARPTDENPDAVVRVKASRLDRESAPANLGLPVLTGYKGVREGMILDDRGRAAVRHGDGSGTPGPAPRNEDGEVVIRGITITPEIAERWLSSSINKGNRKIQQMHIEGIARDIRESRWMENAQPISFTGDPFDPDSDARLLNGQHRLYAVRLAQIPIEAPIATHIAPEAFDTFDNHAKRNAVSLESGGAARVDDRVLAAAARLQWKEDSGIEFDRPGTPTAGESLQTIRDHPGLAEWYPRSRRKGMTFIASSGVLTYFMYRISREDVNQAWVEEFLDQLETGANVARGNPILKMRMELLAGGAGNKGVPRTQMIRKLLGFWTTWKAWKGKQEAKGAKDQDALF